MLALLLSLCLSFADALNPIIIRGSKMYDSVTKERFMIRGIAYAPDKYFNAAAGGDPTLIDLRQDLLDDEHEAWWRRDIPFLQQLNVNVVRMYEIDPFKSHAKIMKALEDIGVYVVVGLTKSAPDTALPAGTPSPGCFRTSMMDSVERIIANMGIYSNLLAFVVGNEVDNAVLLDNTTKSVRGYLAVPCVKALARDARAFMKNCPQMRSVPLLYAATDYPNPAKQVVSDYLACDQTENGGAVDMFGINVYTWCSRDSTVRQLSSYGVLVDSYKDYNMPVLLSEYGCNQGDFKSTYANGWSNQRTWYQSGPRGLFSMEMKDIFSGGFAYQYSMTANEYGVVLLPGYQRDQPQVVTLQGFTNLATRYAEAINITQLRAEMGGWTAETECTWVPAAKSAPACPSLEAVTALFEQVIPGLDPIDTTQYPATLWNTLPVLSRTSMACPVAQSAIPQKCGFGPPTPPTTRPPTAQPTPGSCDIEKMPGCTVDLGTLSGPETDNLFANMCGLFERGYPADTQWCKTTFDGTHKQCTGQQKIDLALLTWAQFAAQCCVPLKNNSGVCEPYSFGVPSAAPTPDSVPTSPPVGDTPTSAPIATAPTDGVAPTVRAPSQPPSMGKAPTQTSPTRTAPTSTRVPSSQALPPTLGTGANVEEDGGGSTTAVVVTVSTLCVLLVAGAVFYVAKKRFNHHHDHDKFHALN